MNPTLTTLHGERPRFDGGYTQVAEDTWAWLQPNGILGESNSGLIVSGDDALIVDTLWDLKLTQRMLDSMQRIIDFTPQTLFNTHSDGDHVWGNQLLPDARIISTATAKKLMSLDTPQSLRGMKKSGRVLGKLGGLPVPLIGTRDVANWPRIPLKEMGDEFAPFDWDDVVLTLPTETFDQQLTVEVGGRNVELLEVGPAHTGGDAVAWLPDVKVCFAADILFIGGTPIMWAGPISGWQQALSRISELGAETFVPGHGPVCGQAAVDLLAEYFDWVQREGVSQLSHTSPVKAARKLLLSDNYKTLPWADWDDPARLVATLTTEKFVQDGGEGHLVGAARAAAVVQVQLTKSALAREAHA